MRFSKKNLEYTIRAANGIDGRGDVVAVVYRRGFLGNKALEIYGVAVRETQYGMDSVEFHTLGGRTQVKFLGKVRVIIKETK